MNKKINLTKLDVSPAYLGLSKQTNKIYFYLKIANKIQEITYLIKDTKNYHQELIAFIKKYSKENKIKIFALGLAGFDDFEEIATKMWQILDIVPKELKIKDKALKIHAQKACRLADSLFDDEIKKNNLQAAFINSTAAGGGVSLMRHALIRLYSLLGVNMKWIVLKGDKDVFNITKKKIHNVLHGVAAYNIMLNKEDKKKYREWIKDNYRRIKKVISKLNVVIIDDPQPSGLIPLIKKDFPHIKIIYRSHIQIYSKLIEQGIKQNKNTWDFVWKNARLADIFISHPIKRFVPSDVPENKVLYLPATTDRLDGLNKKIKNDNKKYYFKLFNYILQKSGLKPLDTKRPYIIQVARFDPSKGIPDVIETYRKLRKNLIKKEIADKDMPQLVIVGNGANDDPESMPIYHETRRTIEMDTFKEYKDDIKVARLPHNDQLLNVLLDNALVALQLSHREGFEIKVTEALLKGVPIVAYRTGGIPLQIEDGKTGYLVPRKRTKLVAKRIEELFLDKIKCQEISNNAKNNINDNYLTINSAYRWMLLVILLSFRKNIDMKSRKFADLENKYLPDILADLK